MEKNQLYRMKDLTQLLKVSKETLYKWIKKGIFPPPIKMGKASAWFSEDIHNWLRNQKRGVER